MTRHKGVVKMRRVVLILVMLIWILVYVHPIRTQEKSIKIVWREDKGQYYNLSRYETLSGDLQDSGIEIDNYTAYKLFGEATQPISADYFGDPENTIIVIPNPPEDFYKYELSFLKEFVSSRGNLIIMGDIQYDDRHYGKPEYLNNLLEELGIKDKVYYWGTNSNGDEIKDEENNYGRPWQVVVDKNYFNPHIISASIEKVVINSQSLVVMDPDIIIATSPSTSYAEDTTGTKHMSGEIPWLVAIEHSGGKIVVCGSSKMFSDVTIYGTSTPYVKAEDNEQLFFNMIWWISGKQLVAPKPIEMIGILDIFPIIAGFLSGIFLRKEERIDFNSVGKSSAIVSILYSLIATLQVILFGQVIIGTALPDWGAIMKGAGEVPAELNAFIRYLFAGFVEVFVGIAIFIFIEKLDDYLELGIMKRLGVRKGEL